MTLAPAAFERAITDALAASPMSAVSASTLYRLRRGAMRMDLPEGALVRRACDEPFLAFVVDGLIRFFLDGNDGRRKTSRYARAGSLAGTPLRPRSSASAARRTPGTASDLAARL